MSRRCEKEGMEMEFDCEECEDECREEPMAQPEEAKAKEAPPEALQRPTPNVAKKPRVETEEPAEAAPSPVRDYTKVLKDMDVNFEALAPGSVVRPAVVDVESCWQRQSKKALLAPATSNALLPERQKQQKDAAFDLLDATETVIQDTTNLTERVE